MDSRNHSLYIRVGHTTNKFITHICVVIQLPMKFW